MRIRDHDIRGEDDLEDTFCYMREGEGRFYTRCYLSMAFWRLNLDLYIRAGITYEWSYCFFAANGALSLCLRAWS